MGQETEIDCDLKRKLLITGAGGFLGRRLCRRAAAGWQVFGTWNKRPLDIEWVVPVSVDLTDYRWMQRILKEVRPDGVIHTAAATAPNFCQRYPRRTHRINVTATVNLAGLCADAGIPLVFTSTDLVFDGKQPPYREKDSISPICTYGEQKATAEAAILDRHPQSAVCRLPLMIDRPGSTGGGFEGRIARHLKSGRAVTLFTDEFRTPVDTDSAADGLLLALERISGRLHLGGRRRVSRYDMGCLISNSLGLNRDRSLLVPASQRDVTLPAPRPSDVSLDSTKAYQLGYDPTPLTEVIGKLSKSDLSTT